MHSYSSGPSYHGFGPLRAVLYVSASIPLITGVIGVIMSVRFVDDMSHSLSASTLVDPMLNSQWRFICAMWLCYAPILYSIIYDPKRYGPILRIISVFVAVGGLGRCYTALTLGFPSDVVAKSVAMSAIGLELVLPVLFWMLLERGLKGSTEKNC